MGRLRRQVHGPAEGLDDEHADVGVLPTARSAGEDLDGAAQKAVTPFDAWPVTHGNLDGLCWEWAAKDGWAYPAGAVLSGVDGLQEEAMGEWIRPVDEVQETQEVCLM